MTQWMRILAAGLICLAVAACDESDEKTENKSESTQAEPSQTETPEPAASQAEEPAAESTQSASSSLVSEAARNACLEAVTAQTGESNVSVLSTEFSEANSLVMVGVGADEAPWRCIVSNDGQGAEVSFEGGENDTADAPAPAASSSSVSEAARNACLEAVTEQTGESNVSVLSTEFSEANSLVMVGVGSEQAPWRCIVSNDGQGAEVSFEGGENDTADAAAPAEAPAAANYDATGTMPCSIGQPSYDQQCNWGVTRTEPGVTAVIDIEAPDGTQTTLNFAEGNITSSKGDVEYRPDGNGFWLVSVNDQEFYKFADAVISGG